MKYHIVFFYKNYFNEFFVKQSDEIKEKITWTFTTIEEVWRVPAIYLKKIKGSYGLYEIRVQFGNSRLRIFCFFDGNKLVVAINGFSKKTWKIPKNEINKANRIKIEYENEKQKSNKP